MRLKPEIVLSCGDLPSDYLEYIVTRLNVPLLYVPGNHDPDLRPVDEMWSPMRVESPTKGPEGRVNIDGRVTGAAGLLVAGRGCSVRQASGSRQAACVTSS